MPLGGRARKDSLCPKLHQHPRSSCPKITHTYLPETKNIYCIVLLSAVLKLKGELSPSGDSDCPQLKTPKQAPKASTCAHDGLRLLFQHIKLKAVDGKGKEVANEGDTLPRGGTWGQWHDLCWGARLLLGLGAEGTQRSQPHAAATSQGPRPDAASQMLPWLHSLLPQSFEETAAPCMWTHERGHMHTHEHTCSALPGHPSHPALPWCCC